MINKFLLARDKFMPEKHLRQPGFTHSACGPFTKNKERIRKFKDTGYGDFKDLNRTAADKPLLDKAVNITKNSKYNGYQRGLTLMVDKIF